MNWWLILILIIIAVILVGAVIGLVGALGTYFGYKELKDDKNKDDRNTKDIEIIDESDNALIGQKIPEAVMESPFADDEVTQATEQDNVVAQQEPVVQPTPASPVPIVHQEPEPVEPQPETQPEIVPATQPTDQSVENVWVAEHNRIRAAVGQPPVQWSPKMAESALKYSQKCLFEHSDKSERILDGAILGENLAYGAPFENYDDKRIVQLWESEKQYYDHPQYPSQSKKGETGHYTQMVNKKVKQIGCGCTNCDGKKICVCRYNPIQMGNQYPY